MRKEKERFVIYNKKTGLRQKKKNGFFFPYFDTYEDAQKILNSKNYPTAIICCDEIYLYFDEKGNFVKREEIIVPC